MDARFKEDKLMINSKGWMLHGDAVMISSELSSQFASALFLNSFDLDKDVFVCLEGRCVSSGYLEMTLSFLKQLGVPIHGRFPEFKIPKRQKIKVPSYEVERDMSCLFSLSCFAALCGQAVFTHWKGKSLQPDGIFPSFLQKMGAVVEEKNNILKISSPGFKDSSFENGVKTWGLCGSTFNLSSCPDLFPSLSVLCALSEGDSRLYGAPHLKYKESHRIQVCAELIKKLGRVVEIQDDGLMISGFLKKRSEKIVCETDFDHRIAMAGGFTGLYWFLCGGKKSVLCE